MTSQTLKNVGSNLGLFLVFGLLAGMLFHNPAAGVLGGLLCHSANQRVLSPGR
jgi:hypothetical protein